MNLKDLKTLSTKGEGQDIEFKENANQPEQIAEEIVGFANSSGGSLFIGINDQGLLNGLKFPEDDQIFLEEFIKKNIRPVPELTIEIVPVTKSRSILVFYVVSGNDKPYGMIQSDEKSRKILYRVDDLCLQASRELKNILRNSNSTGGQSIIYTDLENIILKTIETDSPVTKDELNKKINFSSRKISDCLVRLVSARVLKIIPTAIEDLYEYS